MKLTIQDISRQLLSEAGVAVVPSGDFRLKNAARISLVSSCGVQGSN